MTDNIHTTAEKMAEKKRARRELLKIIVFAAVLTICAVGIIHAVHVRIEWRIKITR